MSGNKKLAISAVRMEKMDRKRKFLFFSKKVTAIDGESLYVRLVLGLLG